jgi:hypothetical protein
MELYEVPKYFFFNILLYKSWFADSTPVYISVSYIILCNSIHLPVKSIRKNETEMHLLQLKYQADVRLITLSF